MSTHADGVVINSYNATAAIATAYTAVKDDTTYNYVCAATGVTDRVRGIIQAAVTTAGDAVAVVEKGETYALCKSGWTRGDKLTVHSSGALLSTTTGGDLICAIAMDTTTDGKLGRVQLIEPQDYASLV